MTRAHGAVLAGAFLRAGLALAAFAAVVWITSANGVAGEDRLAILAAGGLVVASLSRLVRRVWDWDRTVVAVTEEQLVVVRGAVFRSTETVPLASIEHLRLRQTFMGRLLGYGTIQLSSGRREDGLAFVPLPSACAPSSPVTPAAALPPTPPCRPIASGRSAVPAAWRPT